MTECTEQGELFGKIGRSRIEASGSNSSAGSQVVVAASVLRPEGGLVFAIEPAFARQMSCGFGNFVQHEARLIVTVGTMSTRRHRVLSFANACNETDRSISFISNEARKSQ